MGKCFHIIFIIAIPFASYSAKFYNDDIKKIYSILSIEDKVYKKDTIYLFQILRNNSKVPCRIYIEDSVICHLGIQIFPDSLLRGRDKWIYRFIERKFLLYTLEKNKADIRRDLSFSDAGIYVKSGEEAVVPFTEYHALPASCTDSSTIISVQKDSMLVIARFQNRSYNLRFVFKRNCFNVLGINKIEADKYLQKDLADLHSYDTADFTYAPSDTVVLNDSIKTLVGRSYMEYFHSTYFIGGNDCFYQSLFNSNYPVQSFVSSVISPGILHKEINVLLTHKQYKSSCYSVINLALLINYLKREHELYIGIEDTTNIISGALIAYNRTLNYIHLFCFSSSSAVLFSNTPEYFCKMYSFIPTDNIATLFGAYGKSSKKILSTK